MARLSYEKACAAIDRASAEDPRGQEPLYSQRMVRWVEILAPEASEEVLLAARAQHLKRWTVPRSRQPAGRAGYLKWREGLKTFHADTLAQIMRESGYDPAAIEKAREILLRKNRATDPEGQVLEDAACLVFLQYELAEFSAKTPPDKTVEILRKSWKLMSPSARDHARKLSYGPGEAELVGRALADQRQ